MVRTATCCCGAARIRLNGDPRLYAICHCDNCKRRTGSAFGMSAYFDDRQVLERSGNYQSYRIRDEQQRFFCTNCGTTLYWTSIWQPESTGVAGGCFTEDPLPGPAISVANEGRAEWLELPSHWSTTLS